MISSDLVKVVTVLASTHRRYPETLPGDVARGAAAVCVSPEDDPPGTARSPMGGGG